MVVIKKKIIWYYKQQWIFFFFCKSFSSVFCKIKFEASFPWNYIWVLSCFPTCLWKHYQVDYYSASVYSWPSVYPFRVVFLGFSNMCFLFGMVTSKCECMHTILFQIFAPHPLLSPESWNTANLSVD